MHESDVLIRCEHIGKKFCRDLKTSLWYGVRDAVADFFAVGRRNHSQALGDQDLNAPDDKRDGLRPGEFWAVNNVSFELRRGECLGLVGRNGAGKTTLLKMLNGLIKPDHGRIELRGRVGALIALGAGFNPVLTARENIYVNGSILGLSRRQISDCFEEIVEFSELDEFIDTPVRSFSSGMKVRLGFAIAAVLVKPDVLLLDEVLAVGDFPFRMKCLSHITRMLTSTAIVFVSHNEDQVRRLCTRAILLSKGHCMFSGDTDLAYSVYDNSVENEPVEPNTYAGDEIARITFNVENDEVNFSESLHCTMRVSATRQIDNAIIRLLFKDKSGVISGEWNSAIHGERHTVRPQVNHQIKINIPRISLRPGRYTISAVLADEFNKHYFAQLRDIKAIRVTGNISLLGTCHL